MRPAITFLNIQLSNSRVVPAVVPYYFLVWYNPVSRWYFSFTAVVPYYFLVWYNIYPCVVSTFNAVVPYYFLVWYNICVHH